MESNTIPINHFQSETFEVENKFSKINVGDVFKEKHHSYLNEFTLFLAHFNAIPNFMHEINIDCKNAIKWFSKAYKEEIKDVHYSKRYFDRNKNAEIDDIFYFLYDDLMVNFDTNQSIARFLFRKTDISKVENVVKGIRKFKGRKKRNPHISLLINTQFGIDLKSMPISKLKCNIEDNYNDDFKEIDQIIMSRLSKKNDKGLVLLHGKPGTGKTSYIKHLVSKLNKKIIFFPPNMAGTITNPELLTTLIDNPNSIFVIEDAENIIVDREKDGSSPVSALLNISDGLLSDCLNIQIVCSFNTSLSKIDDALLRKGRLIAKYEFGELEVGKAQRLSDKLGFTRKFISPMALTDIYNQEDKNFAGEKSKSPIGFKTVSSN